MPELPEVETFVRALRGDLNGRRITAFTTRWKKNAIPSAAAVRSGIVDRTIGSVSRRGKFFVLTFDEGGHLLIHLRMSGRFEWGDHPTAKRTHVRATLQLDNGRRLLFCDSRKFGRLRYTRDLDAATAGLGPEPLSRAFTARRLGAVLRQRRRLLKPLLLDQSVVAGLGNIYVDEALHRAGLHPLTRSDWLNDRQIRALHAAIREVLRLAIRNHGTTIDWIYPSGRMQERLAVYGRGGQPCPTCGSTIETLRVGQRGTHICPRCQPMSATNGRRRRAGHRRP